MVLSQQTESGSSQQGRGNPADSGKKKSYPCLLLSLTVQLFGGRGSFPSPAQTPTIMDTNFHVDWCPTAKDTPGKPPSIFVHSGDGQACFQLFQYITKTKQTKIDKNEF